MTRLTILYVDDDADIRTIVSLALSLDPTLSVHVAGSGEEALALIEGGVTPDVGLLDVMMPGVDGLALLDRLRALPPTRDLPVIFITAKGRQADQRLYHARGAIGMILKPFDPLALAAEVRRLVEAAGTPAAD
jgi:two-component system, OmpR family, response regulator